MDLRLSGAAPAAAERAAVDAVLGPPASAWDGGARGSARDAHTAHGGRAQRERRTLLLPALQALQARAGWVSPGGMDYVCERLDVPPAEAWAVATFYAMLATSPRPARVVHVCDDIACRARGAGALCERLERDAGPPLPHGAAAEAGGAAGAWMRSPCLGACDAGPAALVTQAGESPSEFVAGALTVDAVRALLAGQTPGADATAGPGVPQRGDPSLVLLRRVGAVDPESLASYRTAGGYRALARVFEIGPDGVMAEMAASKLVGRGGAAFPTHRKWEAVRAERSAVKHLVCNADESEPGTFKDRVLLAGDPFAVIEAMTIAAFATGCTKGWIYVRAEYPLAHARLAGALAQARAAGLLGPRIAGREFAFDIELRRGAGAYICGEETALFESLEGRRGEPRVKPPFPVAQGLFGQPTVINNVETLANVLPIVLEGGATFARAGTPQSTGTRLFSLSGCVRRPGVYEVPMGGTLRELIALAGGVPEGRTLQAVLLGGAAGTFVRADEIDLKLTLEDARAAGVTLGSGVVMLFDDSCDLRDAVLRVARFFRDESCGQCVPCRVGTARQEEALHRIVGGCARGGVGSELVLLSQIGDAMRDASICGLGQTAYAAVESAVRRLRLFGEPPQAPSPAPARGAAGAPVRAGGGNGQEPDATLALTLDGREVRVAPGTTILEACRAQGIDVPTLCFLETLGPPSACRLCVVEIEGSRVLAPACSRAVEPGMAVHTASERVRHSRRLVLEMLASSVDLSTAPSLLALYGEYGVEAGRFGPAAGPADHDAEIAGDHAAPDSASAASVAQPVKVDNPLYVRDYGKCVLCYRCVEACGEDAQNTFAIGVAGRGFDARISTERNVALPDSACVYCGNCIAVCPTGALMATTEFDMRAAGTWDEGKQSATDTICPYCGVGCTVTLHAQEGRIVKATSPLDNSVTQGNLCIKGRFGWAFVQPAQPKPRG